MSQYGFQQQPGAPRPAQAGPLASTSSGAQTPSAGGATRSGRQVKPVRPYQAPAQPTRARSGLNPLRNQGVPGLPAQPAGPPPPPQRHPLSQTPGAVPPLTRITGNGNERKQAMFTTFPARMRLGTSTLVQPNVPGPSSSSGGKDGGTGSGTGANTPILAPGTRRIRSTVNYADLENLDDDDDGSDAAAADARKRGASGTPAAGSRKRGALAEGGQQGAGAGTPKAEQKPEVWGDGKSYLGVLPPGNLVQVQPTKGTKHTAWCASALSIARVRATGSILTLASRCSTEDQLEEAADVPPVFIPVQIDLDVDTFKIRDCFVWNVRGTFRA